MLVITVKAGEVWDADAEQFITLDHDVNLQLEHSLISISKWEARWKKPYLSTLERFAKTKEEVLDYIKCMTVSNSVNPNVYKVLSNENLKAINDYITDPMTGTWFADENKDGKKQKNKGPVMQKEEMTSELIYYYMTEYGISWEAQKWHLNRLLTLLRVHSEKESASGKKMSTKDILSRNASLNKARRAAMHSKG